MHWVWPQEEKGIRPHLPQKGKEDSTDETLLSEFDLFCRLLRLTFWNSSLLNKNDVNQVRTSSYCVRDTVSTLTQLPSLENGAHILLPFYLLLLENFSNPSQSKDPLPHPPLPQTRPSLRLFAVSHHYFLLLAFRPSPPPLPHHYLIFIFFPSLF